MLAAQSVEPSDAWEAYKRRMSAALGHGGLPMVVCRL
jgi:hypothetical protein